MDAIIRSDGGQTPVFSHRDYAMQLMQFCAQSGRLSEARQSELREVMAQAVGARAAEFSQGRSTTVSRRQAEAFYASVFCQLDAALLSLGNDELAMDALCTLPCEKLLEAGAQRILTLYEEAKADFRAAYAATSPVQTSFFRDLLRGFEQFTTSYDARFHAKDAQKYVAFCYPLMRGTMPDAEGIFAVHAYYRALRHEGEFLQRFPADEVHQLMERYAARFLTSPDMIAENIAELVFRHWIIGALNGDSRDALLLPEDAAEELTAQFAGRSEHDLRAAMEEAVRRSALTAEPEDMRDYLIAAVPTVAAGMHARITDNNLPGWLAGR